MDNRIILLEIDSSQVTKLYSVFHKTGSLLFSKPHLLALNKKMNEPQAEKKENCRIQ